MINRTVRPVLDRFYSEFHLRAYPCICLFIYFTLVYFSELILLIVVFHPPEGGYHFSN